MREISYTVTDENGIHARPAGGLVKLAARYQSRITLHTEEKSGDAKRIFSVMGLGIRRGQTLRITIEGTDEEEAALALTQYMKENL